MGSWMRMSDQEQEEGCDRCYCLCEMRVTGKQDLWIVDLISRGKGREERARRKRSGVIFEKAEMQASSDFVTICVTRGDLGDLQGGSDW